MKLEEALELHDELNPKLWNGTELKQEVYDKLFTIYEEFIKEIKLPLNIVDVEIVGSNASYNYNENSDIDLHIIVNSEVNFMDAELLQQFYNAKKNSFNNNYDISIYDIPVELYIEDIKSGNATNGRYSLLERQWVMTPVKIKYNPEDIPDIEQDLISFQERCDNALSSQDDQEVLSLINEIYMMRKLGLEQDGEISIGNLIFKELRSMDYLNKLKERYYELRSDDLTLDEVAESLIKDYPNNIKLIESKGNVKLNINGKICELVESKPKTYKLLGCEGTYEKLNEEIQKII